MGMPPLSGAVDMRTPKKSASENEQIDPSNVPIEMRQHARPTMVRHSQRESVRAMRFLMASSMRFPFHSFGPLRMCIMPVPRRTVA